MEHIEYVVRESISLAVDRTLRSGEILDIHDDGCLYDANGKKVGSEMHLKYWLDKGQIASRTKQSYGAKRDAKGWLMCQKCNTSNEYAVPDGYTGDYVCRTCKTWKAMSV